MRLSFISGEPQYPSVAMSIEKENIPGGGGSSFADVKKSGYLKKLKV